MSRECPECSNPLSPKAVRCNGCGWTPNGEAPADPNHGLCCYMDRGQRCGNTGALTESTKGSERWYCAQHFPLFSGRYASNEAPHHGDLPALPETEKRGDGRDWARRVLWHLDRGGRVAMVAERAAREALRQPISRDRRSSFTTIGAADDEAIAERLAIQSEAA